MCYQVQSERSKILIVSLFAERVLIFFDPTVFATSFLIGVLTYPKRPVLNCNEHPRSRITVHLADSQLQLNWLVAVERAREWEKGRTSKKRSQYPVSSQLAPRSRESPRRLRNVVACKCVMYFIIVNIGDVRRVWISTIFTMSPRQRLISAGPPINHVSARFRTDRLKCFAIRLYLGNLYQARNEIELAINKVIYHVKSDKHAMKC